MSERPPFGGRSLSRNIQAGFAGSHVRASTFRSPLVVPEYLSRLRRLACQSVDLSVAARCSGISKPASPARMSERRPFGRRSLFLCVQAAVRADDLARRVRGLVGAE